MENKSGLMVLVTKANGKTIRLTDLESYIMLMETFTKGSGEMTKQMAKGLICMQTERSIKETGGMINNTVWESRHGQMELYMQGTTQRVRRMGLES